MPATGLVGWLAGWAIGGAGSQEQHMVNCHDRVRVRPGLTGSYSLGNGKENSLALLDLLVTGKNSHDPVGHSGCTILYVRGPALLSGKENHAVPA